MSWCCFRPVPEAISSGSAGGESVPELPARRARHAQLQLHAHLHAQTTAHVPAPHVVGHVYAHLYAQAAAHVPAPHVVGHVYSLSARQVTKNEHDYSI